MNTHTDQMNKWESEFGKKYTNRNTITTDEMNIMYCRNIGITRTKLNEIFLSDLNINRILEVGCNIGIQLIILSKMGYKNLYGIELQEYAVDKSKEITKGKDIHIIKGSAFDIPYKDTFFDFVFTSGLLIHISPNDINSVLKEIYRCSKKYIWGYEYYSDIYESIKYRGENNLLWKTDFVKLFTEKFNDLKLIKEKRFSYLENPENIDTMYLLKK